MENNITQLLADTKNLLAGKKPKEMTEEDKLLQGLTEILENANDIEQQVSDLDPNEKEEFFKQLGEKDGIDYNGLMKNGIPTTTSEIIANIPTAIVEQRVNDISIDYPLMGLVTSKMVRNGILQMFYKDTKTTGTKSGFKDVTMKDFNQGRYPQFTEILRVTEEISAGYDILDSILNDVTIQASLFVSLINDYVYAIARPLAEKNYERLLSYLDTTDNYMLIKEFTKATPDQLKSNPKIQTEINAQELAEFVILARTPNRINLTQKPNGSPKILQHIFDPEKAVIVMNAKYATNYTYNLLANTFNMGKILLPFAKIIVLDFDVLNASLPKSNQFLKESELLIFENGGIMDLVHYNGAKTINTPKLKSVTNVYTRRGMHFDKTKLSVRFKVAA